MIPIGDDNIRGARPPLVTYALVAINVIVFLYEISLSSTALDAFFGRWAVQPAEIMAGKNLISLLTSMFLHGGWMHLIGNMVFLLIFGDNIEAVLGHIGYLIFYLAGGLAASSAHVLFNANNMIPSLGASGAIAAVMGAYIVMFPHSKVKALIFLGFFVRVTRVSAVFFLGIWFIIQLFNGVAELGGQTAQTSGVAFWAHIGGFIFGLASGYLLRGRVPIQAAQYDNTLPR